MSKTSFMSTCTTSSCNASQNQPMHIDNHGEHDDNDDSFWKDQLEALLRQEASGYTCGDYLAPTRVVPPEESCASGLSMSLSWEESCTSLMEGDDEDAVMRMLNGKDFDIDESSRLAMVQWMMQIVDYCKFPRSVACIGCRLLDVAASSPLVGPTLVQDRHLFQRAAMTCLYTAVKIHAPEAMEPLLISQLSRHEHSPKDVEEMELLLLQHAWNWKCHPPTGHVVVAVLVPLLLSLDKDWSAAVTHVCQVQCEAATLNYATAIQPASVLAAAALLNAFDALQHQHQWPVSLSMTEELEGRIGKLCRVDTSTIRFHQIRLALYESLDQIAATSSTTTPHKQSSNSSRPKDSTSCAATATVVSPMADCAELSESMDSLDSSPRTTAIFQ